MELNPRESCQDKAGNVRAELNCCGLCGHIREPECWSSIVEYRMSSKHSSRVICLELLKDDNIDAKKVQTCMKNIPSRQPRNTVPMLTEKCKASIWNATCKNYEDENSKGFLTAKKEPEIKLKQYKSCNIQSFAWEKFDKNEEDKFVEYYLDTALQFNLVPDRCFQYPQNELPFIQNSGNENNSFSSIYTNCGSSKHVEIISPTNLPAQFSNEYFNNAISGLKPSDSDIFVNTNYASLDYQYTCDCTNALQKEESGRCSSFSDNSIKRNTDLLCIDSNNTRSVQYDISGKLVKSKYSESVHSNCEMHSVFVAESDSANSECEFMGHSGFESELLDHEREPASSAESLFKSSKSISLEDHLYSSQSDLKSQSESSHIIISEHMPSCCFNLKESVPVFSDGWSECQFSSQSEPSHSDTKEKDQSSTELISFPTVCTEESTIALSKGQNKLSFSAHLESCLSDKLRTYHGSQDLEQVWINSSRESNYSTQSEASLLESSGEALYVMPKMCAQFDNKLVSSSFRYYLLPDDQRQSEIRSIISSQLSSKSAKSHGIAFLNTTNANILSKSKEFFDVSAFKFGLEAGRYRMATKGLGVHEKPYLIRPLIIYKGTQSQVKNRHQVMQFYFTLMTALSIGESLKWLFQLQPRTIQALQGLQPILIYPFTNLNEFFSCKSRESPPGDEECMSVEWMRLQTFENYPITASGSPNHLAREGFYYTGQGTQTRCFSCGVTYGEWKYFDNPCEVHQRLSPNCPFLNGRQEGHINIPMSPDERGNVRRADRDSVPPPSLPVATLSTSGTGQNQGSRAVFRDATKTSRTINEDDSVVPKSGPAVTTPSMLLHPVEESAQSETDNRPKFAEHVLLPSRIATFSHGWPPYLDQTPQQMAEAGFFFTDIITKSKETTVLSEFSVLNLESTKLPLVESSIYSNSEAQGAWTVAGMMLTAHTNSSSNVRQGYSL